MNTEQIAKIVDYWLGPSLESPEAAFARRDVWYDASPAVDDEIRSRFGALMPPALAGDLIDWQETPDGALALVLLLDQFTRNLYRNTPEAYAGDASSFEIMNRAIDRTLDRELHPVPRIWLYHPFHHSEEIEEQDRGIGLLKTILSGAPEPWHPYIERSIWGWGRHRDIVARFGRFPHRNEVLGRVSTEEERAFLAESQQSFGQGPKRTPAR
ncbi:MAG: DUF924 domain-containing protein [Alphaproteobacteria bacterium]|nr:DUF924 domain-containing protein [Alphaproteobacteria bacterium]